MKTWLITCTLLLLPFSTFAEAATLDASDSGWYNEFGFHDPNNRNYITGFASARLTRSFFVFDLSSVTGTIISATLRVPNFQSLSPDPSETFALFDVTTDIATLTAGGSGLTAVYDDLGTGVSYGSGTMPGGISGASQDFLLNPAGLAALNAAGGFIAIGGAITTLSGQVLVDEYAFGFTTNLIPQLLLETSEAVPEPGALWLAAAGIVMICVRRFWLVSRRRDG